MGTHPTEINQSGTQPKEMIPFSKPSYTGKEIQNINEVIASGKISGNGVFTKKCEKFFEEKYHLNKCLLTTSCTDALEMAAILANIREGDEVIMPSYTFVSTANAFVLRGAKIVFADSREDHPGIDESQIESLITSKTRAIVPVHYAGVACDMEKIMTLAEKYRLFVIEDAAQGVDGFYKTRPLGGIGHFGCFSFHETKNIHCGEGGMLIINDPAFVNRAEIIWEKGTNRSAFIRGEVNKYEWVDIGSSFLPSDLIAAFLLAQLDSMDEIQRRREEIWNTYQHALLPLAAKKIIRQPVIPAYASNNQHMYYLVMKSGSERNEFIRFLRSREINAAFHYISLHHSRFFRKFHDNRQLPYSDLYTDCLVRLPFYSDMTKEEISFVAKSVNQFFF